MRATHSRRCSGSAISIFERTGSQEVPELVQESDRGALLAKGGFDISRVGMSGQATMKYNGMLDPAGAEELVRALAQGARHLNPNLVIIWEEVEDVVLAHILARELSVNVVRAFDDDGLVGFMGSFPQGARALLVTDLVRSESPLRAVEELVSQQGGQMVGLAVLVEDKRRTLKQSWPIVSLTESGHPDA